MLYLFKNWWNQIGQEHLEARTRNAMSVQQSQNKKPPSLDLYFVDIKSHNL